MANIARASLMPAGSVPPVASLEDGDVGIIITKVKENNELEVTYPDGFVRDHQAVAIEDLIPKIVNNLRARYGVASVTTKTAPAIAEGVRIVMEVSNNG